MTLFCISHWKSKRKNIKKHLTSKNTIETNEISTCVSLGLDLRTTPDGQNHPKAPRALPRHSERTFCVFGPFWLLPEDPLGPPEDPLGTPRNTKRTPKEPPRTPQDYERTPKDPQGLSKKLPRPLRDPNEAQRSLVNRWKVTKQNPMYKQIRLFRKLHGS